MSVTASVRATSVQLFFPRSTAWPILCAALSYLRGSLNISTKALPVEGLLSDEVEKQNSLHQVKHAISGLGITDGSLPCKRQVASVYACE